MRVIPVPIKGLGYLVGNRSNCTYVKIVKDIIALELKVLVGDVSTADYAGLVVDCERLVVHASVSPFETRKKIQPGNTSP